MEQIRMWVCMASGSDPGDSTNDPYDTGIFGIISNVLNAPTYTAAILGPDDCRANRGQSTLVQ
jgi:hypothetical protein